MIDLRILPTYPSLDVTPMRVALSASAWQLLELEVHKVSQLYLLLQSISGDTVSMIYRRL